jgi:hypothetical protein
MTADQLLAKVLIRDDPRKSAVSFRFSFLKSVYNFHHV